jgi:hypothetical protein
LIALKMEGAIRQEMKATSRSQKRQKEKKGILP